MEPHAKEQEVNKDPETAKQASEAAYAQKFLEANRDLIDLTDKYSDAVYDIKKLEKKIEDLEAEKTLLQHAESQFLPNEGGTENAITAMEVDVVDVPRQRTYRHGKVPTFSGTKFKIGDDVERHWTMFKTHISEAEDNLTQSQLAKAFRDTISDEAKPIVMNFATSRGQLTTSNFPKVEEILEYMRKILGSDTGIVQDNDLEYWENKIGGISMEPNEDFKKFWARVAAMQMQFTQSKMDASPEQRRDVEKACWAAMKSRSTEDISVKLGLASQEWVADPSSMAIPGYKFQSSLEYLVGHKPERNSPLLMKHYAQSKKVPNEKEKSCRFKDQCKKQDCKFYHPDKKRKLLDSNSSQIQKKPRYERSECLKCKHTHPGSCDACWTCNPDLAPKGWKTR